MANAQREVATSAVTALTSCGRVHAARTAAVIEHVDDSDSESQLNQTSLLEKPTYHYIAGYSAETPVFKS
jgi:hypothetical protein